MPYAIDFQYLRHLKWTIFTNSKTEDSIVQITCQFFFFLVHVVSFRVHAGTMCAHGYVVETLTRSLFQFFTTSHTPLLQPSGLFGLPPGKDVPERVRARPNVSATATLETATLETTGSQIHGWIKSSYHSRTRF